MTNPATMPANLVATPGLDDVPRWERTTPLMGGPGGEMNAQAQALLNRIEKVKAGLVASVKDFGATGDGTTDDTAALAAARAWLATTRGKLVFPSGAYLYSVSPNWAIHHAEVAFEGEVKLRYTGTGNAVIIDASAGDAVCFTAGLLYALNFGWANRPTIEAPATAGHGLYVVSAHHCKIGARVRGCGTASDGLHVAFAVCSQFDVSVTVNEDAWYASAKPANGYYLTRRNAGETTSYCTFLNPIVEGTGIGVYRHATLGNTFVGGTFEGCTQYGAYGNTGAAQDKFIGTDFEFNTSADVYEQGSSLALIDCDTTSQIALGTGATNARVVGGKHKKILVDAGCLYATVADVVYNRFNDGTTFTDAGTGTVLNNVRNGGSNVLFLSGTLAYAGGTIANNSTAVFTVTVSGAKFGDFAQAAFPASLGGMHVSAYVSAADTVTLYAFNNSGAGVTLAAGTIKARVVRQ